MPVDRTRRDEAADALASYLRADIDRAAIDDALRNLAESTTPENNAESQEDAYLAEMLSNWLDLEMHMPISEQTWEELCREIAFLKSDLEKREFNKHRREDKDRPREILLARFHLLGLIAVFGVAYLVSWWILAAGLLLSFVLYQVAMSNHWKQDEAEWLNGLKDELKFYPFANQDEWKAHKYLLDQYRLPPYDPAHFNEPPRQRKWPRFLVIPARTAIYLFVGAVVAYMYLFSIVLWPVWLILMSLCRRESNRSERSQEVSVHGLD